MNKGTRYSLILHTVVAVFLFIELPNFGKTDTHEDILLVDIVPTSTYTNLHNAPPKQQEKQEVEQNKGIKKVNNDPPQKKEPPKDIFKPPTKQAVDKKLSKEIDDLLGSIKEIRKKNLDTENNKNKSSSNKFYDDSLPLSITDKDNIKSQIERKFVNPVILDFKPGELVIKIKLEMSIDGSVTNVLVLKTSKYSKHHMGIYNTLKESLIRASHMASPLTNLPKDKYTGYKGWKEIELTFDAHSLMNIN
ncbi:MAG: hypothetical protein KBC27_00120 [Rickettsiales bacterium]|nr:hypothetical protein [Rickettsiales bacterium]